jgi:hypothetical protein
VRHERVLVGQSWKIGPTAGAQNATLVSFVPGSQRAKPWALQSYSQ